MEGTDQKRANLCRGEPCCSFFCVRVIVSLTPWIQPSRKKKSVFSVPVRFTTRTRQGPDRTQTIPGHRPWTGGHVVRRKDGRWAVRMLHWIPHRGERRRGRPATRWEDALEAYAQEHGQKWETWAEDNNEWRTGEAGFANRATVRGGGYPK